MEVLSGIETHSEEDIVLDVVTVDQRRLILFNDEVNTFEHVIECLVAICEHDPIQAEQCAMITHYKGKCAVRRGEMKDLEPLGSALGERGLTVEIQ